MRAILGCGVVLLLLVSAGTAADEPIDPAKLIGKWSPSGAKVKASTEFTKDGKAIMTIEIKGQEKKYEGTYKVDKNQLTTTTKRGDKDIDTVMTIKKLTDDELVLETPKFKKTDTLKRVK